MKNKKKKVEDLISSILAAETDKEKKDLIDKLIELASFEGLKITGTVTVERISKNGKRKKFKGKNIITTVGKTWAATLFTGTATTLMSHMAVGSDVTPVAASDTHLGPPAGPPAELGRVPLDSITSNANVITMVATFPAGTATGTWGDAGLFDSDTNGIMGSHILLPVPDPKGPDDSQIVTWTWTLN